MSNDNQAPNEKWPKRLNKALILVGLMAFALIVADRVIDSRSTNKAPIQTVTDESPVLPLPKSADVDNAIVDNAQAEPVEVVVLEEKIEQVANESTRALNSTKSETKLLDSSVLEREPIAETMQTIDSEPTVSEFSNTLSQKLEDNIDEAVETELAMLDQSPALEQALPKVIAPEITAETEEEWSLEGIFGGRVVFVSVSNPAYLITENSDRFDVGGYVSDGILLAAVTPEGITFEKDAVKTTLTLPEPGE